MFSQGPESRLKEERIPLLFVPCIQKYSLLSYVNRYSPRENHEIYDIENVNFLDLLFD